MPPDDEVNVRFTESGADAVSSKSNNVADALTNVADKGQEATQSTGNLEQGMSALSGVAGQVDPKLGFLVSTLNTLKVASAGAASGLASLVASARALLAALGGPIVIAIAAGIFLLSKAFSAAREEAEKNNRAMEETKERIKAIREEREKEFLSDREQGLREQAEVERQLSKAQRDPRLAADVISRAVAESERRQIPFAQSVSEELIKTIGSAPVISDQQRISGLRGGAAGELLQRELQGVREAQRATPRDELALLELQRELEEQADRTRERLDALPRLTRARQESGLEGPIQAAERQAAVDQAARAEAALSDFERFQRGEIDELSETNQRRFQRITVQIFNGPVNAAPDQFNPAAGPGPARRLLESN